MGILSYWSPFGAAPALLANTTEADSGRLLVFSPIRDLGPYIRSYATVAAPEKDEYGAVLGVSDMRLSTVMGLSARFPYITPAGSVVLNEARRSIDSETGFVTQDIVAQKARLVDGGYFENSGIATAIEMMRLLDHKHRQGLIDLRLIVFDLTEDKYREPSYGLGELMSPIKALLSVRTTRSVLVQNEVRREFGDLCRYIILGGRRRIGAESEFCPPGLMQANRVWSVSLNDAEYDFELGWILSRETLQRVERQVGNIETCPLSDEFSETMLDRVLSGGDVDVAAAAETMTPPVQDGIDEEAEDDEPVLKHNSCIARFIRQQLIRQEGL